MPWNVMRLHAMVHGSPMLHEMQAIDAICRSWTGNADL